MGQSVPEPLALPSDRVHISVNVGLGTGIIGGMNHVLPRLPGEDAAL